MALPPREVPVNIPSILGVSRDNILSFDCEASQFGASFSFRFVLAESETLTIAENSYITLLPGVLAFVDDVVYSVSSSGKTYTVTGRVLSPDMYRVKSTWYVTSEEFRSIGTIPHVTQPKDVGRTGSVQVVADLSFTVLITRICSDNGIPLRIVGSPLDYKIHAFYLDGSSDLSQTLQSLCLQAGANLIVRYNEFIVIPWGFGHSNHTLPGADTTIDLKTSTDNFPFKDLILKGSDEPTPWNGFYIGLPEKIATLNFEAGPIAVKDISYGSGVVQPSKDWIFPEDGINNWQTFSIAFSSSGAAGSPLPNFISSTLNISSIWDYKYLGPGQIDYRRMFADLKSLPKSANISAASVANDYKNGTNPVYKGLVAWKNMYTVVPNSEDIFPIMYVLPSDIAPDQPGKDLFDIPDGQQLILSYTNTQASISGNADFDTNASFTTGVLPPPEFTGITPNGYGVTCKDSNGNVGFNPDGSFVLPATFSTSRALKKVISEPAQTMAKVYIQNGFYTALFTKASFEVNSTRVHIKFPSFTSQNTKSPHLADHLRTVMHRTQARAISLKRPAGAQLIPNFGPSITAGDIGYTVETLSEQAFVDAEDADLRNNYNIVDILPEYDNDGNIDPNGAFILITPPSATARTDAPFTFFRERHNHKYSLRGTEKVSTNGVLTNFALESGLVDENSESIQASWSVYAVKRKTYPVTVLNGVPYYFGLSDEKDAVNNAIIDAVKTKFTKNVTAPNITHTVGNGSDLVQLSQRILAYMSSSFSRSSRTFAAQTINIPPIGAVCADGIIVSSSISISDSGAFISVNCGAFPII